MENISRFASVSGKIKKDHTMIIKISKKIACSLQIFMTKNFHLNNTRYIELISQGRTAAIFDKIYMQLVWHFQANATFHLERFQL